MSDLAEAVVRMMRAHEFHRPDRYRPSLIACSGTTDPLTGNWCQFRGTPTEHYHHQIERVTAALTLADQTQS